MIRLSRERRQMTPEEQRLDDIKSARVHLWTRVGIKSSLKDAQRLAFARYLRNRLEVEEWIV